VVRVVPLDSPAASAGRGSTAFLRVPVGSPLPAVAEAETVGLVILAPLVQVEQGRTSVRTQGALAAVVVVVVAMLPAARGLPVLCSLNGDSA
jgi:hypothetical protein